MLLEQRQEQTHDRSIPTRREQLKRLEERVSDELIREAL